MYSPYATVDKCESLEPHVHLMREHTVHLPRELVSPLFDAGALKFWAASPANNIVTCAYALSDELQLPSCRCEIPTSNKIRV